MKKLIYFLLLIFSFCCFFSCSNVNCEYDFAQENKKNEQAQDKVFVTFKLKKETVSRTILPTEGSLESLTDLELYYFNDDSGNIKPQFYSDFIKYSKEFITNTFTLIKKFSTVEEMENTAIEWTYCDISDWFEICLFAKDKDGSSYYGCTSVYSLPKYEDSSVVEIVLEPQKFEKGEGTGALDLVFSYPAQIQSVDVQLYRYEDKTQAVCDGILEIDSANNVFTYKHAALPADIYELCVTQYTDAEKKYPVNKYKEIVVISSNCTSAASRTLGNANNEIYKITYDFDGGAEFVENAEYPEYYSLYSEVKLPDVSMIKSYEGKTFDGWYIDGDSYTRLDSLKPGEHVGDILLKAGYCYETDKDGFEALLQTLKDDVGYTVKVNGISTAEDLAVLSTAMDTCKKKIALDLSSCTGLTEIPDDAFYEKKNLLGIVMPDTVEIIGEYAFGFCENMLYANMPKNLKTIKPAAFRLCESLGKDTELIIPDGCESIGNFAFGGDGYGWGGCAFTSITIPASVTSVGYKAFEGWKNLKNIYYDAEPYESENSFNGSLFSLETIHLGKNVKCFVLSQGGGNLNCPNYHPKEIHFSGTLEEYLNIEMDLYQNVSPGEKKKHDLYIDGKLMTDVVIPEGVTEIKEDAFRYANITSVTIPDSVTSIGMYAFDGCDLKTIRIGTGIKSLDGTGLTGYDAKYYYNGDIAGLLSIDGIEFGHEFGHELGVDSFSLRFASLYINDELVTDLVIPDGVTEIKRTYFQGFSHQFDSITIPRSVTKIEPSAFVFMDDNEKVVDIYYQGTMQEWMNIDYIYSIDDEYGDGYYYTSGLQFPNINLYIDGQLVTDFVIPDGIEEIPNFKFYNFNFSSVSIPDSVKKIGKAAFYGTHLKSVNTGAGCKEVGDEAFANISELEEITFGDSVETIGENVCGYSAYNSSQPGSLKKVTLGKNVSTIKAEAFKNGSNKNNSDASALEEIHFNGTWEDFFNINWEGGDHFTYGAKIKFFISGQDTANLELPDGLTSINADVLKRFGLLSESITIPASITSIGGSFYSIKNIYYKGDIASWCAIEKTDDLGYSYNLYINNELVKDLIIPAEATTISAYSFAGCASIENVNFEDNCKVTEIEYRAFEDCKNLKTVTIGDSVTSIGNWAFYMCTALTDLTINNNISYVGKCAFDTYSSLIFNEYDNCNYLGNKDNPYLVLIKAKDLSITSCEVNPATRVIADEAFFETYEECNISSLTIGENVITIGKYAFASCDSLTSVVIPDSVTSIYDNAFSCDNLENAVIGSGVNFIGYHAFYGEKLISVTFTDTNNWYTVLSHLVVEDDTEEVVADVTDPAQNAITLKKSAPSNYYLSMCKK